MSIYVPVQKIFTSPEGAVAKYCDEHVSLSACVSVCLSVCLSARDISGTTRATFTTVLCMLPLAVVWSSSGTVTKSQGEMAVLGFFPSTMHYTAYHLGSIQKRSRCRLG